jgi:hypothetical protein
VRRTSQLGVDIACSRRRRPPTSPSLSHCSTVQLLHCPTAPLSNCSTAPLLHESTAGGESLTIALLENFILMQRFSCTVSKERHQRCFSARFCRVLHSLCTAALHTHMVLKKGHRNTAIVINGKILARNLTYSDVERHK